MITTTDLIKALERNLDIIKSQTQGLTHADSVLQPPFRGNCLNWVVGHIATSRSNMLQALGEKPIMSEAQLKRYDYGSEPVCADGEDILKLEQLLTMLEQSQKALTTCLQKTGAEELAREVQSFLGTTTLGQLVFFLYWHETYHTGQTEALRELTGKHGEA